MAGNKEGGETTARKILARDPDFYKKIGAKGGANGHTGGFAANPELASIAGKKGGLASKKTTGRKQWEKSMESKPVQVTVPSIGVSSKKTLTLRSLISLMKRK